MNQFLDCFPVIDGFLTMLQRHVRFLPGRLAAFVTSAARHLAEKIRRPHFVNLDLKDRFDRLFDLRLGRPPLDAKRQQLTPVLRLFFSHQRLLGDHWRLDCVPNGSHRLR
jgi:hypothetical protein